MSSEEVFEYHYFDPTDNDIHIHPYTVEIQFQLSTRAKIYKAFFIIFCVIICSCCIVTPICMAFLTSPYWGLGWAVPFALLPITIWFVNRYSDELHELVHDCHEYKEQRRIESENAQKATIHAKLWRIAHPLEEQCRLALTKNPNYVADLIRYVHTHFDHP